MLWSLLAFVASLAVGLGVCVLLAVGTRRRSDALASRMRAAGLSDHPCRVRASGGVWSPARVHVVAVAAPDFGDDLSELYGEKVSA